MQSLKGKADPRNLHAPAFDAPSGGPTSPPAYSSGPAERVRETGSGELALLSGDWEAVDLAPHVHLLVVSAAGAALPHTLSYWPANVRPRVATVEPSVGLFARFADADVRRLLGSDGSHAFGRECRARCFHPDLGAIARFGADQLTANRTRPAMLEAASLMLLACAAQCLIDPPEARPADRRFDRVLTFVEDHLDDDLLVGTLADVAGMSPFHFSRRFKDYTGSSPHSYVLGRRVERAISLLNSPENSLAQVAYASGFSSQSHMTAVFKQAIGTTPGHIRKRAAAQSAVYL